MIDVQKTETAHNRYILKEKLAEGGMGAVYRAIDRLTGNEVALKQVKLNTTITDDPSTVADSLDERNALAHEFSAVASIRHPNIISVLDFGFWDDGAPFFTMEYLKDFQDFYTATITKPIESKIDLLIDLLNTLEYLHRRGVLHRDIKPGNVVVHGDTVQVLDFGLSADKENLPQEDTEDAQLVGTIAYMAPEVLQGEQATASSDLYAVGVMAFEVFTGKHPFDLKNVTNLILKIITEDPDFSVMETINIPSVIKSEPPESKSESDQSVLTTAVVDTDVNFDKETMGDFKFESDGMSQLSNPLSIVVSRLLAKSAEDRYESALDVVVDFNNVLDRDVIDESASVRESYLQSARFVGREVEIGTLQDALEETFHGQGSAWLIGGETGVGKSRLIDELRILALVRGFTTVRGNGVSENPIPYQLWREPIRRMILHSHVTDIDARILKDIVNDIERLLDHEIEDAEQLDGDKYRERMQASILNLFNDVQFPLLLILEDIHWAPNSIDTINRLATIIQDKPIMVIATYRQDEAPQLAEQLSDFQLLELRRLRRSDIIKLAESIIGSSKALNKVVDLLYRETAGNIYFIIEILRELAEQSGGLGAIDTATLTKEISSAGVLDILQQRLKEIPAETLELLKLAALHGREINLAIMEQIHTKLDLDEWLVLCSNSSLLDTTEEGQWRFVHDAMRRTVLNAIDPSETKSLHHKLALALEKVYGYQTEQASILATHWRYAENYAKEYRYIRIAAEYALHVGNLSDARTYFERILELIDTQTSITATPSDRAQIEISLVKTLHILGEYESALDVIQKTVEMLRSSDHIKLLADALIEQAEVLKRQGKLVIADELVQEALDKLKLTEHKKSIVYALDRLSDLKYEQGDYATATQFADQGVALAREIHDHLRMGSLLTNLGMIAFVTGENETAQKRWRQAKEIHIPQGQRREVALLDMNMGSAAGQSGDLDTCLVNFQNALEVFKTIGDKRLIGITYNNLGYVASLKGDFLASIDYYEESLVIARSIKNTRETCIVLLNLGDVIWQVGDYIQAKANFWEALQLSIDSSATPIILQAFSYIIQLFDSQTIVPIVIGHVLNHPATNQETRERCGQALEKLREQAAHPDLETLLEQGKHTQLDDLVTQILGLLRK